MLRYAVTIFLLLSFMVQSFDKLFVILDYQINKSVFMAACVNKVRPAMNCNGQCLLMKKIQEKENAQQKNPELKLENKNQVYIPLENDLSIVHLSAYKPLNFGDINSGTLRGYFSPIFRPPGA